MVAWFSSGIKIESLGATEDERLEAGMRIQWIAALAIVAVSLTPSASFAQKKVPAAAGKACLTAKQTCATDCNAAGYCIRMVCEAGKWRKTVLGCMGNLCPPKC